MTGPGTPGDRARIGPTGRRTLLRAGVMPLALAARSALAGADEARAAPLGGQRAAGGAQVPFRAGFYIYPGFLARVARQMGVPVDEFALQWMTRLRALGFRLFYVALKPEFAEFWVALAARLDVEVVLQLDFAYLYTAEPDEVARKAPAAIAFIRRHRASPGVIGFSIREEPSPALMPNVARYFARIRAAVPDARLHLLHNDARAAADCVDIARPDFFGVDRYPFWGWDASAGGYAATPDGAIAWYARELAEYARRARRCGGEFQVAFNARALIWTVSRANIASGGYGDAARVLALAERRAVGWEPIVGDRFRFIKYYRPPAHATRAMTWLAALNGARSVLHWSGEPTEPAVARVIRQAMYRGEPPADDAQAAFWLRRGEFAVSIFGLDNEGSPQLEEFAQAVAEIARVDPLLRVARPLDGAGDVRADASSVRIGRFALDGDEGQVLVLVDTAIGEDDCGRRACAPGDSSSLVFDRLGDLHGYRSATGARERILTVPSGAPLYDVSSGAPMPVTRPAPGPGLPASVSVSLTPGRGVVLYQGSAQGLARIRDLLRRGA